MNEKIRQAVLVIMGILVGILVYSTLTKESDVSVQTQPVNLQEDAQTQENLTYSSYTPITGRKNEYWTQISGDAGDTCMRPTFIGEVNISGWYEEAISYVEKEWLLRVDSSDMSLLPWDLIGINPKPSDGSGYPYVKIINATPESEFILKQANSQKPAAITVTKFSQYCEGVAFIEVENSSIAY